MERVIDSVMLAPGTSAGMQVVTTVDITLCPSPLRCCQTETSAWWPLSQILVTAGSCSVRLQAKGNVSGLFWY